MKGPHRHPIADLRVGDHVDLEDDPIADPPADRGGDPSEFEFEYVVVDAIEVGPGGEVVVEFEQGFACAFPPDHRLVIDRDVLPPRDAS